MQAGIEKAYRLAQVATALNCSRQVLYDWIKKGYVVAVRIGDRDLRITESEYKRLITSGRRRPATAAPDYKLRAANDGDGTETGPAA